MKPLLPRQFNRLQKSALGFCLAWLQLVFGGSVLALDHDCREPGQMALKTAKPVPWFENRKLIAVYKNDAPLADKRVEALLRSRPKLALLLKSASADSLTSPIDPAKSLLIVDSKLLRELDLRDPQESDHPAGTNAFAYAMAQIAAAAANPFDATALILDWFGEWRKLRPDINRWPRREQALLSTDLNPIVEAWQNQGMRLSKVPFRLIAVVNRLDLADQKPHDSGYAGELRLIFAYDPPSGAKANPFHAILEYQVNAKDQDGVRAWAAAWCRLGQLDLDSAGYRSALATLIRSQITAQRLESAKRDAIKVRTNESLLFSMVGGAVAWQFREFVWDRHGRLRQTTVSRTPQPNINVATALRQYFRHHIDDVLKLDYELPARDFQGKPFRGDIGESRWGISWDTADSSIGAKRHEFALRTCNGCHHTETKVLTSNPHDSANFAHVFVDAEGNTGVSDFLKGPVTIADPVDKAVGPHTFSELERRKCYMDLVIRRQNPSTCSAGPRMVH